MKTLKYITLLAISIIIASCEVDYLSDPNKPEVAPTYGILNRVQKRLMDDTRNEWFSGRQALLWVQYWNQTAYTEEDRFQYRETTSQGGWEDLYFAAQDLTDIIVYNTDETTKGDMAKYGPNESQIAMARIMLVYIYQIAVETWGDVPYAAFGSDDPDFQANKIKYDPEIKFPMYASQAKIFPSMLKELKEAAEQLAANGDAFTAGGDNFYNGNAEKWIKFANSLRLRIATRVNNTTEANAAVAEGVFESNGDNAGLEYETTANNASPMYRAFYVENRIDFAPSFSLVEFLKGNRGEFGKDPRLEIFADENSDGFIYGIPLTANNGVVGSFKHESLPGKAILSPGYTEIYMEYAEVCFLLSELNGWDQSWYEKGVTASMEKWGVMAEDIEAFVANLPAASEETVITQKYIALYMQPYEAWSELRRTGYPTHLIQPNETYTYEWKYIKQGVTRDTSSVYTYDTGDYNQVISRINYPLNEESVNKEMYLKGVESNGGNTLTTPLFWMK